MPETSHASATDDASDNFRKRRRAEHGPPAITSARRALSCTECKRRRTKCSSVGQIPCEACVRRRKPEACVWEGVSSDASNRPDHAHARKEDDTARLRREVDELRSLLMAHIYEKSDTGCTPRVAGLDGLGSAGSVNDPFPGKRPNVTPSRIEGTISDLEISIAGPYVGARSSLDTAMGGKTDTSYGAALNGLEPGSIAGSWLLEIYFSGQVHRSWPAVQRSTFMAQYDGFVCLPAHQHHTHVHSAWLAEYTMVLALTIKLGNAEALRPYLPSRSASDLERLPDDLYLLSVRLLEDARYMVLPQIRHIQVSMLYVLFHFHFGRANEQINLACRHLDSAITTAQWLGLDEIDAKPSSTPFDDAALWDLPRWAAMEICRRLYHMLVFMDGTIVRQQKWRRISVSTKATGTLLPGNYAEEDMLVRDPSRERPESEVTIASLARIGSKFATMNSRYADFDSEGQIDKYDRELRDVAAQIPWNAMDTSNQNIGAKPDWMMPHLYCSILNRLMRIHRPRIVSDYASLARSSSRHTTVESAKTIIQIQDVCSKSQYLRPGFLRRWILGAALVLAVDAVLDKHAPNIFDLVDGRYAHEAEIKVARDVCRRPTPYDADPETTRACADAIEAMQLVLEDEATGAKPSQDPEADLQNFLHKVGDRSRQRGGMVGGHDESGETGENNQPSMISSGAALVPASELLAFDWLNTWITQEDELADPNIALGGLWENLMPS